MSPEDRIQPWPESPRYRLYNGIRVVLLGGSIEDNLSDRWSFATPRRDGHDRRQLHPRHHGRPRSISAGRQHQLHRRGERPRRRVATAPCTRSSGVLPHRAGLGPVQSGLRCRATLSGAGRRQDPFTQSRLRSRSLLREQRDIDGSEAGAVLSSSSPRGPGGEEYRSQTCSTTSTGEASPPTCRSFATTLGIARLQMSLR